MKKARKELNEVQDHAVTRRHLLESGAIRINRTSSKSPSERSEQERRAKEEKDLARP